MIFKSISSKKFWILNSYFMRKAGIKMGEGPGKIEILLDRIVKIAEELNKKERREKEDK